MLALCGVTVTTRAPIGLDLFLNDRRVEQTGVVLDD